ncbi:MAG: hypothetical protein QG573_1172 [Acidobacteriota bacterium]|nr:hypothetical protein [Acidobacteriota bacterium]
MRTARPLRLALAAAILLPLATFAGTVEKDVPFKLDQWIELASTDGPVTLHRVRLVRQGGVTKSSFMRPGSSKYLDDVQIQLEFTNDSSNDWEARMSIEWLDGEGKPIDGYQGEEGLDSEQRHDQQTVTLSTLKYGLDRARKLKISIDTNPD